MRRGSLVAILALLGCADDRFAVIPDAGGLGGGGGGAGGAAGAGGGTDGSVGADASVPANCPQAVSAVIYTQSAWNGLADAFAQDPSPCADYYISIPAPANDKTQARADQAAIMRGRGARFHAMAEFHWGGWSQVTGMTWLEKGIEFRRRMEAAGYDVAAGDTWAINELPSTVRSDPAVRANVRAVVQGLHDGPAGAVPTRGTVFTVGLGQNTTNLSVYKANLEDWLLDAPFWVDMNSYVRFWAQEVYADPDYVCVGGTTVADRSSHINDFIEHVARLAAAGPNGANTAQSYLSRAYVPLMNGVWKAQAGYGNTNISLVQMEHHVSTQVYAVRAWASTHDYPDGRVGFAWAQEPDATATDLADLAARMASAIHYAYDEGGGSAARACSPSGAYTFCQCTIAGAQFNDAWQSLATF